MNKELSEFIVTDKDSFIEFMELLRKDLVEDPETWKNKKLGDFLKAFTALTEDIQVYYDNSRLKINSDEASWRTFADVFKGSTIYESN